MIEKETLSLVFSPDDPPHPNAVRSLHEATTRFKVVRDGWRWAVWDCGDPARHDAAPGAFNTVQVLKRFWRKSRAHNFRIALVFANGHEDLAARSGDWATNLRVE